MNLIELERALHQLRLGGMAAVLETRLRQAQAEAMAPVDLISSLVSDELSRRSERLLERRRKQAAFRDPQKTLDNFDFTFNPKMNRAWSSTLATCAFIGKREDALFLGRVVREAIPRRPSVKPRSSRATVCRPGERHAPGTRAGRRGRRRYTQGVHGIAGDGAAAHHRRLRHAQAAVNRGRGSAGDDQAPLRACQHAAHIQPPRRGLGSR